jgi:hypothetical protein
MDTNDILFEKEFVNIFNDIIRVTFKNERVPELLKDQIDKDETQIVVKLTNLITNPQKYEEVIKAYYNQSKNLKNQLETIKINKGSLVAEAKARLDKKLLDTTKMFIRQAARNNGIERQIENHKPQLQAREILFAIKPTDLYPDINIGRGREDDPKTDKQKANVEETRRTGDIIVALRDEGKVVPKFSEAHRIDNRSLERQAKKDETKGEQYNKAKKWIDTKLRPEKLELSKEAVALAKYYKKMGVMPDIYKTDEMGIPLLTKKGKPIMDKDNSTDRLHYAYMVVNGIKLGVTNDKRMAEDNEKINEVNRIINLMPREAREELGLPIVELSDKINMMHTSEFNEVFQSTYEEIKSKQETNGEQNKAKEITSQNMQNQNSGENAHLQPPGNVTQKVSNHMEPLMF